MNPRQRTRLTGRHGGPTRSEPPTPTTWTGWWTVSPSTIATRPRRTRPWFHRPGAGAHQLAADLRRRAGPAADVLRSAVAGDTVWSEWEMTGTRRDGTAHLMRG